MTLDEFHALTRDRIPTPGEFVAFARHQGWGFKVNGDKAALVADKDDPLAVTLARMLGREPYRTNVLAALDSERVTAAAAEANRPANVVRPAPPGWPAGLPAHCGHCDADAVVPGGRLCEPAACPLKGRATDDPPPQS
jgi:hypothetical protein